jgi:hypothetical protein
MAMAMIHKIPLLPRRAVNGSRGSGQSKEKGAEAEVLLTTPLLFLFNHYI